MDSFSDFRNALAIERDALTAFLERADAGVIETAVDLLDRCEGRVVVIGMGKCGHVASKLAATYASTGTPATFVHPAEALHGDLGFVQRKDVAGERVTTREVPQLRLIGRLGREQEAERQRLRRESAD